MLSYCQLYRREIISSSAIACGCRCTIAAPRELLVKDKQLRAVKFVSLGHESLAPGWSLTHVCTSQQGSSRAKSPYAFLKGIIYGPGMCWRVKGKSGTPVDPTALVYKHRSGSRNPPADPQAPICSQLSLKCVICPLTQGKAAGVQVKMHF